MNTKILIGVLAIGGVFTLIAITTNNSASTETEITQNTESAQTEESTIPESIPSHVPMYPDAILKNSQDTQQDTEKNTTLSLTTSDTVADVNTWYRGALSSNNWAVTKEKNIGGYVLFEGENANVTVFVQAANTGDGSVTITQRIKIR